MGGVQDKAEAGAKPFIHPALSILACVFRQTSVGEEGSARWEMLKTCKREMFPTVFV